MYRTQEQFDEIYTNAYNGNWTRAAELATEYGFWYNDLAMALEAYKETGKDITEEYDTIARVAEKAVILRAEQGYYERSKNV